MYMLSSSAIFNDLFMSIYKNSQFPEANVTFNNIQLLMVVVWWTNKKATSSNLFQVNTPLISKDWEFIMRLHFPWGVASPSDDRGPTPVGGTIGRPQVIWFHVGAHVVIMVVLVVVWAGEAHQYGWLVTEPYLWTMFDEQGN